MLRDVDITGHPGRLFLTGMPGRYSPLEADMQEISEAGIDAILALASLEETRRKSPDYAGAIADNRLPCLRKEFPITDYSVPADREAYLRFVYVAADDLQAGKKIVVHCGAGIGRTGMTAVSILTALGYPLNDALLRVEAAGSGPETPEQDALIEWASRQTNPFPPQSDQRSPTAPPIVYETDHEDR